MRKKEEKKIKREWKDRIFNIIFAVLTLLIPILFYRKIMVATILLSLLAIIGLIKWKSKLILVIFFFGAIFGAIAEMVCVYFGVWNYTLTNFVNIPFWLFIVWGNAAAFIYQSALGFKKLGIKK